MSHTVTQVPVTFVSLSSCHHCGDSLVTSVITRVPLVLLKQLLLNAATIRVLPTRRVRSFISLYRLRTIHYDNENYDLTNNVNLRYNERLVSKVYGMFLWSLDYLIIQDSSAVLITKHTHKVLKTCQNTKICSEMN